MRTAVLQKAGDISDTTLATPKNTLKLDVVSKVRSVTNDGISATLKS